MENSDNVPLAKNALVFMAVCVNGGWKVPIRYFLIDSMNITFDGLLTVWDKRIQALVYTPNN